MARSHVIENWNPEDTTAWEAGGEKIAKRNLLWSVVAEHVGFSVWSLWSVLVLFMPEDVYGLGAADKFLIAATATATGAVLRLPYSLATAKFGGRNWTVFSAVVLLIPTGGALLLVLDPGHALWAYLLVAALSGFGGGNFASSMTNINAFFPQRLKGWALGLNAGGGNLGVPVVQLLGLLVIATVGNTRPEIVCGVYLVLLAVAGIGAALYMDNIDGRTADLKSLGAVMKYRDSWLISLLYIGTFGSFIGFSFAFGQVLQQHYLAGGDSPAQATLHAAQIAFLGPLLGSIARVYGGKWADRIGGGLVTAAAFVVMLACSVALAAADALPVVVALFIVLFIASGVGNGSVYKLIPDSFEAVSWKKVHDQSLEPGRRREFSQVSSGALIGVAGAIGGLGGVGINMVLRQSYLDTGDASSAFAFFAMYYVVAAVITLSFFTKVRRRTSTTQACDALTYGERAANAADPALVRQK